MLAHMCENGWKEFYLLFLILFFSRINSQMQHFKSEDAEI
jgi:hypothetical protein